MNLLEVMKSRHSVRQYLETPIELEKREALNELAKTCSSYDGLRFEIVYDEPKCFSSIMAKYGKFSGCNNYIVVISKKNKNVDELAGYYGEKLVIKAQELGLNTCWVGLTHGKCLVDLNRDEKILIVISLGYGENQGREHKNKESNKLSNITKESPEWFKLGMEAVLLAPTAMNQQKFYFELRNDEVYASHKIGSYSLLDLGIAKYHFEAVTGKKVN